MSKRINQPDRNPKPNSTFTIEAMRFVPQQEETPRASGSLNYLGKGESKQLHKMAKRIERVPVGKGQYVGFNGRVTAFVWLEADQTEAANDQD